MSFNQFLRAALLLALASTSHAAPLTYLGELIDGGEPANGRYDLQLTVHSDAALDSALALPITVEDVAVENGRFRVDADFGPLLRAGLPVSPDSAWLEIAVRDAGAKSGFDSLAQREKIALDKAIAACWSSTGDDGSNPAINFLGTLDAQPLELRVNNQRAARFEPTLSTVNLLQGSPGNSVQPGARGAVIAGGGATTNSDPDFANEGPNRIAGHYGVIGGGHGNTAGAINEPAASAFVTIGGGERNFATGLNATIGGGRQNDATERQSTVAGGGGNEARGPGAAIGGGFTNRIFSTSSAIAGGDLNRIELGADEAAIGGGNENVVSATGTAATIAGGNENVANGAQSTIGGGSENAAIGSGSTVAGGRLNTAASSAATVGGGTRNSAPGSAATVPGGSDNCAGAAGSLAAGSNAIVRPGGTQCGAGFAAGGAGDSGSFVWSDRSGGAFASSGPNQFLVRAVGGVAINGAPSGSSELTLHGNPDNPLRVASLDFVSGSRSSVIFAGATATESEFVIASTGVPGFGTRQIFNARTNSSDVTAMGLNGALALPGGNRALTVGTNSATGNGAHLTVGGTWTNGSSRTFKQAFESIDPLRILDGVLSLPLSRWEYRGAHDEGRHLGPMAEDFFAAFGLGGDERYITTTDASGVALAAIQGLNAKLAAALEQREREASAHARDIDALRAENAQQRALIANLAGRIDALDASR